MLRQAGILLAISSLASPYGIGTMGRHARQFIRFLHLAKQRVWQVLPVGPTGYGNSPYQPFSSKAGNHYLIDLEDLIEQGLLLKSECRSVVWSSRLDQVDYSKLYTHRLDILCKAATRLLERSDAEMLNFFEEEDRWLNDYALFMVLKKVFNGAPWNCWPDELKRRQPEALSRAAHVYKKEIAVWKAIQYLFFKQWKELHTYAREWKIALIGDIPMYVAEDSVDVWTSPQQFCLNTDLKPYEVAGCPPDGFSATGQLWGNPIFNWKYMKRDSYSWWLDRLDFQLKLYDSVRIDHFRGFDAYYAIPADSPDASQGIWKQGPGVDFIDAIKKRFPEKNFIAEDLGFHSESVEKLLEYSGFLGMKVLELEFDHRDKAGITDITAKEECRKPCLPSDFPQSCVAYVGTHDNNTAKGWLDSADKADVDLAYDVLKLERESDAVWQLLCSIWQSPATVAIIQAQDLLGLGAEARINTPATLGGNWCWRAQEAAFSEQLAHKIARQMERSGRASVQKNTWQTV